MLIDNDLNVHVIEVNGRPQLQDAIIDKAVNRPMLAEILKIVGFHIPTSVATYRQFIAGKSKGQNCKKFVKVKFVFPF